MTITPQEAHDFINPRDDFRGKSFSQEILPFIKNELKNKFVGVSVNTSISIEIDVVLPTEDRAELYKKIRQAFDEEKWEIRYNHDSFSKPKMGIIFVAKTKLVFA